MSLRLRSLIVFSITLISLILIVYAASRTILIDSFSSLEEEITQSNLDRVLNDLKREIDQLDSTANDWAAWDDTYIFISDRNPEFARSNLMDDAFIGLDLDLVLLIDSKGEKVFAKAYDLEDEVEIPISKELLSHFRPGSPLLEHPAPDSSHTGLIQTSDESLLFSARPIVTSDEQGPIHGTLVFGRFLTARRTGHLNERLRLSIEFLLPGDPRTPRTLMEPGALETSRIEPIDSETIAAYSSLADVYGDPALVVKIEQPRSIYLQGTTTTWFVTLSVLVAGLIFGLIIFIVMEKLVLIPLATLSRSVIEIGKTGKRIVLSKFSSKHDELAQLASSIDEMLDSLEQSKNESETLRQAGTIVAGSLDQGQAITHILEQLGRVVPYDSASVQLLSGDCVEIVGGRGWKNNATVIGLRFPIPGENPNTIVIQSRQPYVLQNAPIAHSSFQEEPHNHINSWLGVPLIIHDQVIGMLAIDKAQPDFFTSKHQELATAFADQVAISIDNARLYSDLQRRIGEMDALRATVADITAELELPKLLRSILIRATTLLEAAGGDLGLYEEESNSILIVVSHNIGKNYTGTRMALGEGAMGQVALTHEPLIVRNYQQWEGRSAQYEPATWFSAAAAPLLIGKRLVGAIGVIDNNPDREFTISDQNLLTMFAQQAAIAVENARLYEEAHRQAITDSLTGLYNRRGLFELGAREVNRLHRNGQQISAIMLDIDHFKQVNDNYSHLIGDQVLREIAVRVLENVREIDLVGRYGGEEFAILLPETDIQKAQQIADRLRKSISSVPIETSQGNVEITISLGVTGAQAGDSDLAKLLDRADTAMYRAKQCGRNQIAAK